MTLAPYFIPWAILCFTLALIAGCIGWLAFHRAMIRWLRFLWLSDLAAAWLAIAAAYHLVYLNNWWAAAGEPYALWALCAFLGIYGALRLWADFSRHHGALLALAVLAWALVIAAGFEYLDRVGDDAELLAGKSGAVTREDAPVLAPLRRGLLLNRLEDDVRALTARALAMQTGVESRDPSFLSAWRLQVAPRLAIHLRRNRARFLTYQWLQLGLLGGVLALWGFGRPPDWEEV